jgi:signal transduction histidine kinase
MTPEVKEKAFDVFFTTKPLGQGTGLGLAVTKDLIVAGGGSVTVESEMGSGSRFVVELPLAPPLT